jgi:hypothetical protein
MRVDCGELDPAAVIRPELGEWHPRMPERLDEEKLADWRDPTQIATRDANASTAAYPLPGRHLVLSCKIRADRRFLVKSRRLTNAWDLSRGINWWPRLRSGLVKQ